MEPVIDKRIARRLALAAILYVPLAVFVSSCGLQPDAESHSSPQGDVTGSVNRAPIIRRQYSLTDHRDAMGRPPVITRPATEPARVASARRSTHDCGWQGRRSDITGSIDRRARGRREWWQPRPRFEVHTVVWGDTLYSIARRYHVSLAKLVRLNKPRDGSHLQVGDRLVVPDTGSG